MAKVWLGTFGVTFDQPDSQLTMHFLANIFDQDILVKPIVESWSIDKNVGQTD